MEITGDLIKSYLESMKYIFMIVAYILCIVYMYKPNTEYMCFILFIVLHVFLLILFFGSSVKNIGSSIKIFPFDIGIWNGFVPIKFIFIIGWILLLVANSILIQTYRVLHAAFGTVGQPIDLGDSDNYLSKDNLKIFMIITTILLWILMTFNSVNVENILQKTKFNIFLNNIKQIKNSSSLIIAISTLLFSSLSVYLSQQLGSNTRTITTPPSQ